MKIEDKLTASIIGAIKELYHADVSAAMIQLQKTKKEFEGHCTLVVFPLLRLSKKSPEQTANEIGEYLKQNDVQEIVESYITDVVENEKANAEQTFGVVEDDCNLFIKFHMTDSTINVLLLEPISK